MCRRGTWSPQACHPEFPRSHPSPFTSIPRPMIVIPRPIIVIPCPLVVIPSEAEGSETSVPQPLQSPSPASGHPIPRRTGDTRYPRCRGRGGYGRRKQLPTDRRTPSTDLPDLIRYPRSSRAKPRDLKRPNRQAAPRPSTNHLQPLAGNPPSYSSYRGNPVPTVGAMRRARLTTTSVTPDTLLTPS